MPLSGLTNLVWATFSPIKKGEVSHTLLLGLYLRTPLIWQLFFDFLRNGITILIVHLKSILSLKTLGERLLIGETISLSLVLVFL